MVRMTFPLVCRHLKADSAQGLRRCSQLAAPALAASASFADNRQRLGRKVPGLFWAGLCEDTRSVRFWDAQSQIRSTRTCFLAQRPGIAGRFRVARISLCPASVRSLLLPL